MVVFGFLPPANEVCEGYVFTLVYLSTGEGGSLLLGRSGPGGGCLLLGGLLGGICSWGSPGPHPGGGISRPAPGGSPGPHLEGVSRPTPRGVYPSTHRGSHPPPHGFCCGWYASYWNAFLLSINIGSWRGPTNDTLSFYERKLSCGDTMRWWGHY